MKRVPRQPSQLAHWAFAAALAAASAHCDRPGQEAAAAPSTAQAASRPVSNTSAARCVIPLPASPPEPAFPAAQCPTDPLPPAELGTIEVSFPDAPSRPRVLAEHALTAAEKTRGLMYRTDLPEEAGMLFTWEDERPRSFWMKNTCLALDMLFIDSQGVIVSILEQVPTLNQKPRPSGCPAQHVLEVRAGWSRRNGVKPGQKLQIGN